MTQVVRVKRHLDSETVHLPEVRALIGHDVEIVVREADPATANRQQYPLSGSVLRYDEPLEPVAEDDWEALA